MFLCELILRICRKQFNSVDNTGYWISSRCLYCRCSRNIILDNCYRRYLGSEYSICQWTVCIFVISHLDRLQLLGIGSGINFQSNAPSDVATCVNVVYHLMERIRLQKKHLEEVFINSISYCLVKSSGASSALWMWGKLFT